MNILIYSNNLFFNIGLAQCFRDIQETLLGLNIIHLLSLNHFSDSARLDVTILSLENLHDYQAAAELALRYQSLVVGFTSAGNVRRGRAFFADTLLRVSQRESVSEVGRLLRRLADHRWLLAPRHQHQNTSSRQRAPLNPLERRIITATMKRQSVNQLAVTLGINRKRVYNGLKRIKVNFHLISHAHFHHFMISGSTFNPLSPNLASYTPGAKPAQQRQAALHTAENIHVI